MRAIATLLLLSLSTPAWAQSTLPAPPPRIVRAGPPTSEGVAMAGIVMVGAGFGMMLYQPDCTLAVTEPHCGADPQWLAGGIAVMGAGVLTVYLGLRPRLVVVSPMVSHSSVGVRGQVRWGAKR